MNSSRKDQDFLLCRAGRIVEESPGVIDRFIKAMISNKVQVTQQIIILEHYYYVPVDQVNEGEHNRTGSLF